MSDSDSVLLFEIGEEWSLVVDFEVENSMLVWETEAGSVDGRVLGRGGRGERKTVEGRKHGEFELDDIASGWSEGHPFVPRILGDLNLIVHIVLHSVDLRVGNVALDTIFIEVVLNLANRENTNLIEGPASNFCGESLIGSLDVLGITSNTAHAHAALDLGIKPSILKQLRRSNDSKASRVSGLHCGDQGQLRSNAKWIFHALDIILGVI